MPKYKFYYRFNGFSAKTIMNNAVLNGRKLQVTFKAIQLWLIKGTGKNLTCKSYKEKSR